ncbi:putative SAM-dependent methyltransferase Bucepa02006346 [Candidatus Burkholderia verschuerenii]|uniref:Putative SAM-dependent methyltransferase Bucepa02006346 n=1 Tax=Candidatus Burkholderia verschuerenii TaxID=242163 RepID=A0A0L0MIF9_9BURK|nr:class I SAM-dependent methyltransferase [Candidatus Burkholderia verschuerenii]KND62066.1 putative SAM-dependent methyltransferase Bucepa02006346 [Candidatus Burkholderia verschuerenii]
METSAWIARWAHLVAPGADVLDVASGSGRHARWFAARGHPVLAVDRDADALASMASCDGIDTLNADLENGAPWPLPADRRFGAVVVTNYLHRPLFPYLVDAVAPGGVLLYETFTVGNQTVGKPSNPAFLLNAGELLDAVRGSLRVIAFEDGFIESPRAAYVQRICAVREHRTEQSSDENIGKTLTIGNTPSGWPRYVLTG